VVTIVVGGAMTATLGPEVARGTFVGLLLASSALWALGAWLFALIREPAGATAGARTPLAEARAGAVLLRQVAGFRRFLLARGLLAVTEVAVPFYVLASREAASTPPVWERFSWRRASRRSSATRSGDGPPTTRPTARR
jgi:hypothetical protein